MAGHASSGDRLVVHDRLVVLPEKETEIFVIFRTRFARWSTLATLTPTPTPPTTSAATPWTLRRGDQTKKGIMGQRSPMVAQCSFGLCIAWRLKAVALSVRI